MKNSTTIIISISFIISICLVGFTCFYLGSKISNNKVVVNQSEESITSEIIDNSDLKIELKEELRSEVKEEVRNELYDEIYAEVMEKVQNDLSTQIALLQEEEEKRLAEELAAAEEAARQEAENQSKNDKPAQQSQPSAPQQSSKPKTEPYIKVHDVTVSASAGTAGIQAALESAVDACSGVVMTDASSIVGIGTFPIYWTASDGATATSYITITE